jgi:hypothetical protein
MDVSFKIGDAEYEIPEVIDLRLFVRALAWDITEYKNLRPFVSTITQCPIAQLNLLDEKTFELILGCCIRLLDVNEIEISHNIGLYQLKPFHEYTFGEFMDIDILLAGGGIQRHATELVSKMYGMPESIAERTDIKKVWPALLEIVKFRKSVYLEYSEFFGMDSTLDDEKEIKEFDISELQYMWYGAVLVLADNQFLNINTVTERPYKEALNFLTWKKHEAEKAQLENLKRKNDIQRRTK